MTDTNTTAASTNSPQRVNDLEPSAATTSLRATARTSENPFATAPFYRKRWIVIVTALVFIPATLLILLSGPVYQNDGEVWDQKKRVTTAVALACLMAFTFIRLSTQAA